LFVTLAGLIFAFTFFYVVAWPSTVQSGVNTATTRTIAAPINQTVWLPLGPIHVIGRKKVTINTVQLNQPSVGVEFVDSRIDIAQGPPSGGGAVDQTTLPSAAGAVLRAGDVATIYIALSAGSPGTYRIRGVALSYAAGWLTRTTIAGPSIDLTVPTAA